MNGSVVAAYLLGRIVQSGHIQGTLGGIRFSYDKKLDLPSLGRSVTPGPPGLWLNCEHEKHTGIGFALEPLDEAVCRSLGAAGCAVEISTCEAYVFRLLEPMWPGVLKAEFLSTQCEPGDNSAGELHAFRQRIAHLRELSRLQIVVRIRKNHPLLKS